MEAAAEFNRFPIFMTDFTRSGKFGCQFEFEIVRASYGVPFGPAVNLFASNMHVLVHKAPSSLLYAVALAARLVLWQTRSSKYVRAYA